MSLSLNRKSCLRGLGAIVPLPFLNLMEASEPNSDKAPLRFVSLFKPNGVHTPSWNISGGSYDDYHMSPLMQSFSQHKQDLVVMDNMGDFGFSSHQNSSRRYMCGHHKNTKSPSLDQIIADKIGKTTAIKSLELTTEGLFQQKVECSYISYNHEGKPIPRQSDPQLVFDQLFRNDMANPEKRKRMSSLLDRVRQDAKRIERESGSDDKHTLDQYFTTLRETELKLDRLNANSKQKHDFSKLQRPVATQNFDERVEAMIDVMAMALWTDQTRCISYMLGNSNSRLVFDFLGVTEQHHYLSHFFRNFSRSNLENLLKITHWHMQKFDSLLTKMKSYKDKNGTLLDHSLVLFGSGMGHSDNHTAQRIPTIVAGKAGGQIKTGRYIRYAENQPLSKLHLTIMQKFGIQKDQFGGQTEALTGLAGEGFKEYRERPFDTWLKQDKDSLMVQGRLRQSGDLNEGNIFYLDLKGKPSVKLKLKFRDFHDFNLPYHNGTAVKITGQATQSNGTWVMNKITDLKSLFGHKPGQQNG